MRSEATVAVIIPALNEEKAIGEVVSAVPTWVDDIVVVDNGSTDKTAEVARTHGARIVAEPRRGYGSACLAGIAALGNPEVVVFLDGDFSDRPDEMALLVDPIVSGDADMVIGSRVPDKRDTRALTLQARFGNRLACALIRLFWNVRYTDLGPFRAVRRSALTRLKMRDRNYGWTVEMQVKAARQGLRVREVPVSYRRRIGKSKISGTLKGTIGAGTKILWTIFRSAIDSCLSRSGGGKDRERLIIFTRYPEPGKTKTRLIPVLGQEGAAYLQRRMTEHVLSRVRELAASRQVSVEICHEGGSEALLRRWLGPDLEYRSQGRGDLGKRMARAFEETFRDGTHEVVLMGTDCPGITAQVMHRAFDELRRNDVVFGPAKDGGYYLVAMRRAIPQLFEDIPWGTNEVLRKTVRIAEELGLSVAFVDTLEDVDRPEDLSVWERVTKSSLLPEAGARISVIIPTLNEFENITAALANAESGSNLEIIVVDGGSEDGTADEARSRGARVIATHPGRAGQMNAGAALATGDVFLFLHADTRLPEGFDLYIRNALAEPGTVAGAFTLCIDAPASGLRIIERLANWRSRRLHMPYGDQAIFVRADTFREVDGFPDIPIMEDFELLRRLHRRGPIITIPFPATTSARRWLTFGILRTTLINQAVIVAYCLGVSPSRIARWYDRNQGVS